MQKKDLADLAFNGLRSHIKERLEGYDFFTITQVHQRAFAVESRSKESQESHRHHRSSVDALDCTSDCSDDESNDVYTAEFAWPSQAKPFTCFALKPIQKTGKMKSLLLMYPSAKEYLMSYIGLDTSRCHILYRRLKS